ncbi:MAG: ABC transporter permease [Pyrinomonadaceae bacterium]
MRKFLAVVKREYIQRVRTKMFIVATILGPLVMSLFGVIPALIFSIDAGGPVRIAVVDQTGKLYGVLKSVMDAGRESEQPTATPANANALNASSGERLHRAGSQQEESIQLEEIRVDGRSLDQVTSELNERVQRQELDGYLILPANVLQDGKAQFFGRNTGDVFTTDHLQDGLSRAVREQRFSEAGLSSARIRELSKPVELDSFKLGAKGARGDSGEGFVLVGATGFIIYLTILLYGQLVLGAVIEEKETRIAEILFSSVKPLPLMLGKLIGVSLVALTQLGVWGLAFICFVVFGASGLPFHIPDIPAQVFIYFALFFLLGFFIYATIYALVGSMVTTAQEGGQLAMPIILLLVVGFYLAFPVIRSPDSSFAFWVSMFPFFSPITMLVRIITQTPPFWQIALSLLIGFSTVVLLAWLASRIYRIGMLMYGKRATIPEVWRWVRQS